MEKRILGIILSVVGIAGLILAGVDFTSGGHNTRSVKSIFTFAILGAVLFFAGISLIRNTKDKAT